MSNIRFLIVLCLLALMYGCTKSDPVGNPVPKHIKRIETGTDSISYRIFYYDSQSRLLSIVDSNKHDDWKSSIIYNSANMPVKVTSSGLNNPGNWRVDSLVYNDRSQVIKKLFTSPATTSFKSSNVYKYDDKGRLIVDSLFDLMTGNIMYVYKYVYDDNDNIVQMQYFYQSGGVLQNTGTKTISYELRFNPYTNLNIIAYILRGDEGLVLSRNNPLISQYYSSGTPTVDINYQYSYEYLLDGLPKKIAVTYSNKNANTKISYPINFIYE